LQQISSENKIVKVQNFINIYIHRHETIFLRSLHFLCNFRLTLDKNRLQNFLFKKAVTICSICIVELFPIKNKNNNVVKDIQYNTMPFFNASTIINTIIIKYEYSKK